MKKKTYIIIGAVILVIAIITMVFMKSGIMKEIISPKMQEGLTKRASDYIIEGKNVYIDDTNVLINMTAISNEPVISLISKHYSGEIDLVVGFDTSSVKPVGAYYNPQIVSVEKSYSCNESNEFFNYTLNPKHFWCYSDFYDEYNETTIRTLEYEHDFETGDLQTATAYWHENETHWIEVSDKFTKIEYDFQGFDKWYYVKGFNVNSGEEYKLKLKLQPIGWTGSQKYAFAVKPSSETIQEAISKGHLYYLDPWTEELNTNLDGYWTMNETSGDANDISGNGVILAEQGTVPNQASGVLDSARGAFSNTNYFRNLADLTFDPDTSFTISAWMYKVSNPAGDRRMIQFGHNTNEFYGTVQVGSDGKMDYKITKAGSAYTMEILAKDIPASEWFHIVATYNGTNHVGELFINNISQGTDTFTSSGSVSNNEFYIGSAFGALGADWGYIDEVGLWSMVLSDEQINQLYNGGDPINPLNVSGGGDSTPPTYSLNQINNTIVSQSTKFSLYVNDETALQSLGQYIFSTNNTGVWANDSAVNFTSTPSWANVTKTLNSTSGISIGYRWYLTDNAGNSNITEIFTLTTTQKSISIVPIFPTGNINVTQDTFFNVTLNVTCTSGTCGTINVSLDPSTYCYQESANVSTACGGLGTGVYTSTGGWVNLSQTYDSDWGTWGQASNFQTSYMYVNYSKPTGTENTSLWQVKDSDLMTNLSITAGCWNYDENVLVLRALSKHSDISSQIKTTWDCYNGTWNTIRTTSTGSGKNLVYEEAMWWNINGTQKSGLIPIESDWTSSNAFYTNSSTNPMTTSSLSEGQSELITFWVNATGDLNTYDFYAFANLTSDLSISNETTHWNVTIVALEGGDTCTCPSSSNWGINLSDNCVISENCNITGYNITFSNNGTVTFNATITVCNIGDLPSNQNGYVGSNAIVNVGECA